jgi:hypothetical protein
VDKPLTRGAAKPLFSSGQWARFVSTERVGVGVESLIPVKREGLFACGINDFLSAKNPCLVLRKTGINTGINGRDLGAF